VGLVRAYDLFSRFAGREMLQDGDQIVVGEASGGGRQPEGSSAGPLLAPLVDCRDVL
jgi:hypothetical protein